jgi:hypothetical protein
MHKLLLTLALIAAPAVHAGTIGAHLASWHDQPGFNNINPGLFYRSDAQYNTTGLLPDVGTSQSVGMYKNSLNRTTAYVAGNVEWGRTMLTLGLGTGYPAIAIGHIGGESISLIGAVSVRIGHWRIAAVPRTPRQRSNLLHVIREF